jgi:hypothetical protein
VALGMLGYVFDRVLRIVVALLLRRYQPTT